MRALIAGLVLLLSAPDAQAAPPWAPERPLSAAIPELEARAADDEAARFALGFAQALRAVERLGQGLWRHGLEPVEGVPILRLPVPANPAPQPIDAAALRALLEGFAEDLEAASASLGALPDASDAALELDLALLWLDLDGDGARGEGEALPMILEAVSLISLPPPDGPPPAGHMRAGPGAPALLLRADAADARWLEGYTQVLLSLTDLLLAHDFSRLFDAVGHRVFARAEGSGARLVTRAGDSGLFGDTAELADAIAAIHDSRLRLLDGPRRARVLKRLQRIIDLSRRSWRLALAETDDRLEWLPNPRQTAPFTQPLDPALPEAWLTLLDEAEAVVTGRLLLPHWRIPEGRGFRLDRLLSEPGDLDPVTIATGHALVPLMEPGPVLSARRAEEVTAVFGPDLFFYAAWFN